MADYISIETLADNLNTDLNALSVSLEGSGDISRVIPFNVVGNIQDYEDSKVYTSDVVVPAIMVNASNSVAASQTYQSYTQVTIVDIYAYTRELDDVIRVVNEYVNTNTGKFTKSNGWTYQQSLTLPDILGRVVDEGEERITVRFNLTYTFIQNGYMSDDVTITLDGNEVPVINYTHKLVKTGVSQPTLDDVGVSKRRNKEGIITKTMRVIHQNATTTNKLHEDIDTGDFLNRTYAFVYTLGTSDYTNSETLVLVDGSISFIENGFVILECIFEKYQDLS